MLMKGMMFEDDYLHHRLVFSSALEEIDDVLENQMKDESVFLEEKNAK
jgi:hypothetical protein